MPAQNSVQFQNVEILTIEGTFFHNIQDVTFPSLQELHMMYATHDYENIFAFLTVHKGLSRMYIDQKYAESDFNVTSESLLANLPNLTELSVICSAPMIVITRILNLEFQENLAKVTVLHEYIPESDVKAFRQSFEDKWIISDYHKEERGRRNWNGLQFIRSN